MVRRLLPGVLAILLMPPAVAAGQEQGVFVDPDSSSAKEYQLPLDTARREGANGTTKGKVKQGDRSSDAFGEGVTKQAPSTTTTTRAPSTATTTAPSSPGAPAAGPAQDKERGTSTERLAQASETSSTGAGVETVAGRKALARAQADLLASRVGGDDARDLNGTTVALLGGGGVALLAGFGGIALRRLRRAS